VKFREVVPREVVQREVVQREGVMGDLGHSADRIVGRASRVLSWVVERLARGESKRRWDEARRRWSSGRWGDLTRAHLSKRPGHVLDVLDQVVHREAFPPDGVSHIRLVRQPACDDAYQFLERCELVLAD
jgi:hypothetical protein